MTNSIPQAAIDAVAETYEQIADEDHEYRDLIGIDWTIIRDGLEAAMPYIRKQIAEEIRYGINEYSGQLIEQAARIAEGETK